uniref:CCHC-type domain-containing protein n=1 Tax=Tanacetum cinerariifolium TaxID=118510 RepID=A0A6L2J1R3_TANCI|nr:hypothetical protein [Tanacetum cinerariifolium]
MQQSSVPTTVSPSQSPQYGPIHPTHHYSTTYPSTPHVITYPSTPYPNAYSPTIDIGLAIPMFKKGDGPIDVINKMISFLSIVVSCRFTTTNNQLRNSSNLRQQATIHDGRVTVQPVNKVVKCFNCQREGHMARQFPKLKGKKDATWFRDKVLLVEAQGSSKVLNNEELEFLVDPKELQKTVLMANLSCYESDVLSEVPHSENTHTNMLNQIVQDINSSAQQDAMILSMFKQLSKQVTNCNKVNKDNLIANESLSAELERYKERVKLIEERQSVDLSTREKLITDDIIREKNAQFVDFEKEINYLKQTLSEHSKEKELLTKTFNVLKNETKEKKVKNIDKEIALIRPMLYDGSVIAKETNVISIPDSEDTLMLEEESRSKMLLKQSDLMVLEKNHLNEITKVQIVFNRIKAAVQQYHVDKQCFEIQKKQFLIENDRPLDQIISQDIVDIVVNSSLHINTSVNMNYSVTMNDSVNYVEMCNKCLELEATLIKQNNIVEKDEYNRLSKSFSKLEQHCISLELAMQLNKEIFQKNNTYVNQTKPSFNQLFELNNLKAELQAKDTTIKKLKAKVKRLNKTSTTNNMKKDTDEIETINIELEHGVKKLITKNEHLKQTCFFHNSIKNNLRKFKGKYIVDNVAQVSNATTIALRMNKLDPVTLASKDKNNRETHIYYLKHIMKQDAILREIVEQAKLLNPLDSASYSTCKFVKLIQELLGYVRDTFPDIHKPSEKLVVVSPINKKKSVRSMFDARHELCFLEFVFNMNASSNLIGNAFPLTRITATNKVPLRKPIPLEVVAQESVVTKVYTRRPKVPKTNGSNSKPKIVISPN